LAALPAPYRAAKLLHQRGRGEVYEATHIGLDRRVVAKILPDVTDEAGLLRQARALASLGHPYAARVLDAGMRGAAGDGAFVVREYVDGMPLSAMLSTKGRLGAALTIRLGAQLLSALVGAHARGLVHAQLRPEHLIVARSGLDRERLVVIDFAGVPDGPIPLRPGRHHLSPELARGEPPTASSDLYGAGVVLYQCLAGAPPFDAPDDVTLFYRAAHEPPTFVGAPAFEHEAVRAFFERALSKKPDGRFESAKEMLRELLTLPIAELAQPGDADATPFDALAEPWLATAAGSATGTHTGLRTRTHVTLSDKEPTLWVLTGDPAIRGPIVGEALEALRHEMDVVFLDEAEREKAIEGLESGRVELPWVVLFGDL
ncbi:MAG: serine/threonine protein kinase, partial [Polyangiaceae bacterium]|nr:serine/threonine protein kinase [Polyangiaceae bacterium]